MPSLNRAQFRIGPGDTLKINVKVVEGSVSVFRRLKAYALAGLTAASIHLLLYEKYRMVRGLSVFSRFIHQKFRQ